MVVDIGTGDGRAALRRARREPGCLVIGLDAAAEPLREASRRAARPLRKGGLANVLYLVGPAEELPGPLSGTAHELIVCLPWGSLLRGVARPEPAMLRALAATLRPAGRLELLLSLTEVDVAMGLAPLDEATLSRLAGAYAAVGLVVTDVRPATLADVDRLSSSWARRLGIARRRPAWLLGFTRQALAASGP